MGGEGALRTRAACRALRAARCVPRSAHGTMARLPEGGARAGQDVRGQDVQEQHARKGVSRNKARRDDSQEGPREEWRKSRK